MIIEVKKFPESQEVMDNKEWFFISDDGNMEGVIGNSAYARVLDKSEYILVEKTTADEYNDKREGDRRKINIGRRTSCDRRSNVIRAQDPGDEDTGDEHEAKEHMDRKSMISSIGYRGEL